MAETKIELVFEQIFIVSAAVYDDGKSSTGMNTGAEGRESQLCSRYENAAYALDHRSQREIISVFHLMFDRRKPNVPDRQCQGFPRRLGK